MIVGPPKPILDPLGRGTLLRLDFHVREKTNRLDQKDVLLCLVEIAALAAHYDHIHSPANREQARMGRLFDRSARSSGHHRSEISA